VKVGTTWVATEVVVLRGRRCPWICFFHFVRSTYTLKLHLSIRFSQFLMVIVVNNAMDNVISQVNQSDLPECVQSSLISFAREEIPKSQVIEVMDGTLLSPRERDGINRWIMVIDDTRVSGILPSPGGGPRGRSPAAGPAKDHSRFVGVDVPPPPRSRSVSVRPGPKSRSRSAAPAFNTRSRSASQSRPSSRVRSPLLPRSRSVSPARSVSPRHRQYHGEKAGRQDNHTDDEGSVVSSRYSSSSVDRNRSQEKGSGRRHSYHKRSDKEKKKQRVREKAARK
jgi:hypothetical protein